MTNKKRPCNFIWKLIFGCDSLDTVFQNKLQTLLYVVSWLGLLMAMGMLTTGFYLYYIDGNPPVEFEHPIEVFPKEVYPGDVIELHFYACKYVPVPAAVNLSFFNKDTNDVTGFKSSTSRIVNDHTCASFEFPIEVSHTVSPGVNIVQGTNSYQVNILQTRHVEWQTTEFTVLPPKVPLNEE